MTPSLPLVVAIFAAPAANLPTELWQVAPDPRVKLLEKAPAAKERAVVLIPGLKIHPLRPSVSTRPEMHSFQEPGSEIVRALSKEFDVYAWGYAQTVPMDVVAHSPGLRRAVQGLRDAGYKDIVLIGHSAGGVIARIFVQAYPDSGVTKLITVASPHAGAELADLIRAGYPKVQAPFIQSLATELRSDNLGGKIPDKLEMVCVVCKLKRLDFDGLVTVSTQWPENCQEAGVPAVLLQVIHWDAMHNPQSTKMISDLARIKLTRWNAAEVGIAQKVLLHGQEERKSFFRRDPKP